MDDERLVRDVVQRILRSDGYDTLLAHDRAHALEICGTRTEPIALAILDLGLCGAHLLEELGRMIPEMHFLLISGYPRQEALEFAGLDSLGERFLMKPFLPDRLKREVREILATPRINRAGFAA